MQLCTKYYELELSKLNQLFVHVLHIYIGSSRAWYGAQRLAIGLRVHYLPQIGGGSTSTTDEKTGHILKLIQ
jgi:hypothetical protein